MGSQGGRPTILTDDLIQRITTLVQHGHYVQTVCQSLGIAKRSYYNWLEKGEADLDADPNSPTLHARFVHEVKTAEAIAEMRVLDRWQDGDAKEWLKWATLASRRFRKHWHDKEPEQRNTYVQNNFALMPGQAGYVVPQLPSAIAAEVLSPPPLEAASERVQKD